MGSPAGVAVVAGMVLAVGGRGGVVAVGSGRAGAPVRSGSRCQSRQHRVIGGGVVLTVLLLALAAWLAWRALRPDAARCRRPHLRRRATPRSPPGCPPSAAFGIRFALQPTPGRRRGGVWANLVGAIVAVTAVITAVIFGASLNGVVSHPVRYGWNWNVLIQSQGGYGDWYGFNMDKLMAAQPGVRGWSSFGFTQLPIEGQSVPVLGT